jgi:geranylgeranyl diphosphate synthase, type I
MLKKIKIRIEKEISRFIASPEGTRSLKAVSPILAEGINEFISRDGKRVRPTLFVLGYLGYCRKEARGLYASALSIELMHDFMLVHDDIIDKSDTRRGKPSMHAMLNDYLKKYRSIKFNGQDLAIVVGDVMYAMGLQAFLSIQENKERKEKALKILIEAALKTGAGEFIELLYGATDIGQLKKEDIYKIYDYKTAFYTFAAPLAIGAELGGASLEEKQKLIRYGILLGRAFQIKDDILGMFSEEQEIGKSSLSDLQEAKKTILIWHAYNNSSSTNKKQMKHILGKENATRGDLLKMRAIISGAGALDFARKEVQQSLKGAQQILLSASIKPAVKSLLQEYSRNILNF